VALGSRFPALRYLLFPTLILCAIGVATTRAGYAQEDSFSRVITTNLSPAEATVGDRLRLEIEVAHPLDTTVEGPGFNDNYGGLEVVEILPLRSERDGGEMRTRLEYVLTSFRTGGVTVPPLSVRFRGSGGTGSLETQPRSVDIQSVLSPDDDALRPLKPQLDIEAGAPPAIVPTMYVAIFAALTVFGYTLIRRAIDARPPAPVAPPPKPLGPDDVARQKLDALAAEGVAESDPDRYYAEIAATVRRYLSDRFGFAAYAMTRRELQRDMERAGVDRWPARVTSNLLEQCDAVEFAKFRPPAERMAADLIAAYEIIDLTSPQEAAPSPTPEKAVPSS
jgi:hypothetical protein